MTSGPAARPADRVARRPAAGPAAGRRARRRSRSSSTTTGRSPRPTSPTRSWPSSSPATGSRGSPSTTPGIVGSRRLMAWEVGLIDADPERAPARRPPPSPTTGRSCRSRSGRGRPGSRSRSCRTGSGSSSSRRSRRSACRLDPGGDGGDDVRTARGPTIDFPNGNAACFLCGTCKRDRVLAHQAAGRRVVFIGDGESDRYAAGYADVVFAKHSLERFCLEYGWPFERWTTFAEIDRWLVERARAAFAADPAGYSPARCRGRLFCGRRGLGPGRFDPPATDALPPRGRVPAEARRVGRADRRSNDLPVSTSLTAGR